MDRELKLLSESAQEIVGVARDLGLDFYPIHFEICPAEALYAFGAYGMPVRFTHWSFGKAFHRLKMQYDFNLSRIYELVINSNPAYAFLLEGNKLLQNKLVMGHVCAHVDFFKNNYYFSRTPKDMMERMTTHAEQIRKYEMEYGREAVEKTLDAILAIQDHVDGRSHIAPQTWEQKADGSSKKDKQGRKTAKKFRSSYEDLIELGEETEEEYPEPKEGYEDILLYLIYFAPTLEEWQRDMISMIRSESLYFYPQTETKIINEGWATFWHCRIMRELELSEIEMIDFSLMHSQVVQPGSLSLNPYHLGWKIWEHLVKERGNEEIFDIRASENDGSFLRNYLNRELVEELNLFSFKKTGLQWQVTETEWEKVRDSLVQGLVNGGRPKILACDNDYKGNGSLYLRHSHDGLDLDVKYLERTLELVQYLWGKGVYLETKLDGRGVIFACENGLLRREQIL